MQSFRQRASLIICVGLALVAISIFADIDMHSYFGRSSLWHDIVHGWLPAYGAILSLIGVYHWLARPDIK